jgi:hypothetical protein
MATGELVFARSECPVEPAEFHKFPLPLYKGDQAETPTQLRSPLNVHIDSEQSAEQSCGIAMRVQSSPQRNKVRNVELGTIIV